MDREYRLVPRDSESKSTPSRLRTKHKFVDEIGELRAISSHVLGAARVQIPKNNLDNLHLSIEEDGTMETVDPQDLLGLGLLLYRAIGFLRVTSAVVVILVKGNAFPTIVKVIANTDANVSFDVKENESEVLVSPRSSAKTKKHDEKTKREDKGKSLVDLSTGVRNLSDEFKDFYSNSTNRVNAASAPVTAVWPNSTNTSNCFNAVSPSDNVVSPTFKIGEKSSFMDASQYPDDPDMPALFIQMMKKMSMARMVKEQGGQNQINNEDFHNCMFACSLSQEEPKRVLQALKDPSWIKSMQEELLQFKMQKGHTQEEGIDYEEVFAPVARIETIRLFLTYASFIEFMVYKIDGTIEKEVYVCEPPGFEDPNYPDKVYKVVKALYRLHQAPRAWCETLANYLLENGFQGGKIDQTLFIKK
nr:hypothetical protein [Tanacetum cinerariifolium]